MICNEQTYDDDLPLYDSADDHTAYQDRGISVHGSCHRNVHLDSIRNGLVAKGGDRRGSILICPSARPDPAGACVGS